MVALRRQEVEEESISVGEKKILCYWLMTSVKPSW